METTLEPETLVHRAQAYLAIRDFSSSRNLASQARKLVSDSDPSLAAEADRIATVAGILFFGRRRDLYAVLRLTPAESEDSELLWSRYAELAEALAQPELNNVSFAQEAYDVAFKAFTELSDPETKRRFDSASSSFWTFCPYCLWLFQYGKVYEECCLRCQNCSRAFHGVAIGDPPAEILVPGKDQYYAGHGLFPMGHKEEKKENTINNNVSEMCKENWEGVVRKRGAKAPARRIKNLNPVAEKKMKTVSESGDLNGGGGECSLVYFEENGDDLFVGLEDLDAAT